jgi:hypothetical protein
LPQRLLTKTKYKDREVITARFPEWIRVGTNYDNTPWNDGQWKNVLEQAARLTEKSYDCTELEQWVWWCYPAFKRCKWNTREVLDAATKRGLSFEKERMYQPEIFRRHLMSIGLRISGKKQKQDRTPPLAQFVENLVLPDTEEIWGSLGGFLTKTN